MPPTSAPEGSRRNKSRGGWKGRRGRGSFSLIKYDGTPKERKGGEQSTIMIYAGKARERRFLHLISRGNSLPATSSSLPAFAIITRFWHQKRTDRDGWGEKNGSGRPAGRSTRSLARSSVNYRERERASAKRYNKSGAPV